MHPRQTGVTLMELMVVIAIIGLLTAIAIPTYRSYVLRANRAEAKTALLNTAQNLERCYTRSTPFAYNSATCAAAVTLPLLVANGNYRIAGTINAADYTLTASPQGAQVEDDDCGDFTITNTGVQSVSGNLSGTPQQCWRR